MLFRGDCLEIMPTLPPASVDLILCDLPYGVTQNKWDSVIPFGRLWSEYWRIAKSNAAIILTASQPFASQLVLSTPDFRYDLVWRKNKSTGFLNAKKQPLRNHEHILVFYRALPVYNPQKTNGHEPGYSGKRAKKSSNYGDYKSTEYGGSTERYPLSVLDMPVINNDSLERQHPTQKPIALMEYFIRTYTNEGDTVLDNCMGSGTTGVACRNTNRKFIGIESDPAYFEIARKRVEPMPWEINVAS